MNARDSVDNPLFSLLACYSISTSLIRTYVVKCWRLCDVRTNEWSWCTSGTIL